MERYFTTIRSISALQICVGVLSITAGILQLAYAWDGREWPINSGVGIWAGVITIAAGVLGMVTSFLELSPDNDHLRRTHTAHYAFCIINFSTAGMDIGYSAWVGTACSDDDGDTIPSWCVGNTDANLSLAWVNVTIGVMMIVVAVPLCIHYLQIVRGYYRKIQEGEMF